MANTAAAVVDRVLPDVPIRQYVLSLPYELRRLAAFKADVLTALGGIFVDAVFTSHRARARRMGIEASQCGAINFVQRFGSSVNLNVHFHVAALDGVFTRAPHGGVQFHPAPAPTLEELEAIARRAERRSLAWLRRRGYMEERPLEDRSNESPAQTALDACADIAMGPGHTAILSHPDTSDQDHGPARGKAAFTVDRNGFNLHAGVRIEAGDDLGRERLCRYGARPPMSLERLRRLPGGRIAYRLKYVRGGRGKHRIMAPMEFMARFSALIPPPRYPLVRYAGVLGPRSSWRKEVVPRPRQQPAQCAGGSEDREASSHPKLGKRSGPPDDTVPSTGAGPPIAPAPPVAGALPSSTIASAANHAARDVERLAPNVISVRHWTRLLAGMLYAVTPRLDWASLLRRTFDVDVLECPRCHGRLRVLAVITEREPVRRILEHLGEPSTAPPLSRARDPTHDVDDDPQLQLSLA
jgi:hypothetical protein